MIEITSKTSTGKINLVGLSISTDNDKNYVEVKMTGNEEKITEMVVNTIKDGLDDEGTKKTAETLISILANSIVGICVEQEDDFLANQIIKELTKTLER